MAGGREAVRSAWVPLGGVEQGGGPGCHVFCCCGRVLALAGDELCLQWEVLGRVWAYSR